MIKINMRKTTNFKQFTNLNECCQVLKSFWNNCFCGHWYQSFWQLIQLNIFISNCHHFRLRLKGTEDFSFCRFISSVLMCLPHIALTRPLWEELRCKERKRDTNEILPNEKHPTTWTDSMEKAPFICVSRVLHKWALRSKGREQESRYMRIKQSRAEHVTHKSTSV